MLAEMFGRRRTASSRDAHRDAHTDAIPGEITLTGPAARVPVAVGLAALALLAFVLGSAGCAHVQNGLEWAFFPNQRAVADAYQAERAAIEAEITAERDAAEAEREAIEARLVEAQEAERAKLAELDLERVDLGRQFAKLEIDYQSDLTQLDIRRRFAVEQSESAIERIGRDIERFSREQTERADAFALRMANLDAAYEQRLAAAAESDQLIWSLALGGLGLLGGGGIGAAAGLRHLRGKVAEAKEVGAGVVWQSIEAGRTASPELDRFFRENPQATAVMTQVLNTDPVVMEFANGRKRQRKIAEASS